MALFNFLQFNMVPGNQHHIVPGIRPLQVVQHGLGQAERQRGDRDAAAVEDLEELRQAGIQVFAAPAAQTSGIANYYSSNDMERRICKLIGFAGTMTLAETIELVKRNTRRYAKRQLTWFRSDAAINWYRYPESTGVIYAAVEAFLAIP